jgi:cytoskeletal protein CcmA (bactofilin family)
MSLFNRGDKSGGVPPQPDKTQNQARPMPPPPQPKAEAVILKSAEPPRPAQAEPPRPAPIVQPPTPTTARTGAHMPSVISKTLKIKGQLESSEDIQIDGDIEGDVRGINVKIGQNAKVKGTVYGDEVELAGTIEGKIESKKVTLTGTARMTGDILHQDIKIDSGAFISGSLKPEYGKSDSKPTLKPVTGGASAANVSPLSAAARE